MKSLYALLFMLVSSPIALADMRYDPVHDCVYSVPVGPRIDVAEYNALLAECVIVAIRIVALSIPGKVKFAAIDRMSFGEGLDFIFKHSRKHKQIINKHYERFLRSINTPTAKRLLTDLRKKRSMESLLA